MEVTNQITFKIIIVGTSGVGKSCLLMRYIHDEWTPQHYPTIGLQFFTKRLIIDDIPVKLQIWDTAGQETFKSIVRNFYKNSDAVFIVYSIVDRDSFQSINEWFEEAKQNSPQSAIYVLIGAQKDLEELRQVTTAEGEEAMKKFNMLFFFQTSAKEDQNIELAFQETAKQLFINRFLKKKEEVDMDKIVLDNQPETQGTPQDRGGGECC